MAHQQSPNTSPLLLSLMDGLGNLPSLPDSNVGYIYRVPRELRKANEQHYTPTTVSIGPLHANNPSLDFEVDRKLKLRTLKCFLDPLLQNGRTLETALEDLVRELKGIEEKIRECYAEEIELSSDEFVEMMLLDGCFILALTMHYTGPELIDRDRESLQNIRLDLLLLENQLPFFVLETLYSAATAGNPIPLSSLYIFFERILPIQISVSLQYSHEPASKRPRHLLEFVMLALFSHPREKSAASFYHKNINISTLKQYGIKLKCGYGAKVLTDVSFGQGVLAFPPLIIRESTTSLFMNLLALEKFSGDQIDTSFRSYLMLMDDFVDTEKDVQQLLDAGVLITNINDKHALVSLLSSLPTGAYVSRREDYFKDVYDGLEEYCSSRIARCRANFMRYYYESRWDIVNSMLLFIFTVTQTQFSILSYNPKNNTT